MPDDDRAITYAIDTVASSKDDKLANQLIDFLLGGDGLPKVTIVFIPNANTVRAIACIWDVSGFNLQQVASCVF